MTASRFLLYHKYPRIIEIISEKSGLDRRKALDMLYRSEVFTEIESGIADMHCRSDGYLADEILHSANINL
ncbi:MAG: DUF3791 domain-containing protein [Ruminococcus sp.]|jgi:hypothetical protein|nr:DUF3791 domain-containing protein [Ruminococcus sp.]